MRSTRKKRLNILGGDEPLQFAPDKPSWRELRWRDTAIIALLAAVAGLDGIIALLLWVFRTKH